MELFIAWSGDRSQFVAENFSKWIPKVIQVAKPWMSTAMPKGINWIKDLSERLENSRLGVVVLTDGNLSSPWLLFEAGALSKTFGASEGEHVCTLLVGVEHREVEMPLSQFQSTSDTKEQVWSLVQTINKAVKDPEHPVEDSFLLASFEAFWPELERVFNKARVMCGGAKPARRSPDAVLDEILDLARQSASVLASVDSHTRPVPVTFGSGGMWTTVQTPVWDGTTPGYGFVSRSVRRIILPGGETAEDSKETEPKK